MQVSSKKINGPRLGDLEGGLVWDSEWVWTWGIGWRFPGKCSIGPWLGDLEGVLVWNSRWTLAGWCDLIIDWRFWMVPGWVFWDNFWWETMMAGCSGDQMYFLLGVQQKDVAWSTKQVHGLVMCELGVLVGLVDDRLLRGVKTKVVGSCALRYPHWKVRHAVHGHSSARVERVRSDIFWSESKYGCSDPNGLSPEDHNDVQGADQMQTLNGRIVADRYVRHTC